MISTSPDASTAIERAARLRKRGGERAGRPASHVRLRMVFAKLCAVQGERSREIHSASPA